MATFKYLLDGCLPDCDSGVFTFQLLSQSGITGFPTEIDMQLVSTGETYVNGKKVKEYTFDFDLSLIAPLERLNLCDLEQDPDGLHGFPTCKVCASTCELEERVEILEAKVDENTRYDFNFTRSGDNLVYTATPNDGGAPYTQTIQDVFVDTDTLDVSQFSGTVSNGIVTINHSSGGNSSNIQFPLGVSSVATNSNPDGSTTITYVDGEGNTQTAGVIPTGSESSVLTTTNANGSVTYTHDAGNGDAPVSWTVFPPTIDTNCCTTDLRLNPTGGVAGTPVYEAEITDLISGAASVIAAPAGVSSDANNSLTVGADGLPYYNDVDIVTEVTQNASGAWEVTENGVLVETITDTTIADTNTNASIVNNADGTVTITNDAGQTWTSGVTASSGCPDTFASITDEDARNVSASGCGDDITLHRTLNVGDEHTSSTGNGDISVASLDSNHSASGGVVGVTTDHNTLIANSLSSTATGAGSTVVSSWESTASGVNSFVASSTFSTSVTGNFSTAINAGSGLNEGDYSSIYGWRAFNYGDGSFVNGGNRYVGTGSSAENRLNGSFVYGRDAKNLNTGDYTFTRNNFLFGDNSFVDNNLNSVCFGATIESGGSHNFAFGNNSTISLASGTTSSTGATLTGANQAIGSQITIEIDTLNDTELDSRAGDGGLGRSTGLGYAHLIESSQATSIGYRGHVLPGHRNAMVLSGNNQASSPPTTSTGLATLTALFPGGYTFWTNNAQTVGVTLTGSGWVSTSTRDSKKNFADVGSVIEAVENTLPKAESWQYDAELTKVVGVEEVEYEYTDIDESIQREIEELESESADTSEKRKELSERLKITKKVTRKKNIISEEQPIFIGYMAEDFSKLGYGSSTQGIEPLQLATIALEYAREVKYINDELTSRIEKLENTIK